MGHGSVSVGSSMVPADREWQCRSHGVRGPYSASLAWVTTLGVLAVGCTTRPVTVPIFPPLVPAPKPSVLWMEPFDVIDAQQWREVEIQGHTQYHTVVLDGRSCLQAHSHTGASILLHAIRFDPDVYAWFSWHWRVDQLVQGEALERKAGSDAAARVYVHFETPGLPWQRRSLDYVWSASLPIGTVLSSAYSSTSKIIVVESGTSSMGQWRSVERNLADDYARCFNGHPPRVMAIGLMSDADNTGTEALAYFDEFRISRLPTPRQQAGQVGLPVHPAESHAQ